MKKINMFLKNKKNYGLFLVFGLALLSFVVTNNVSAATHTLTLTSSGSQSINVSASSGTAISSDSINVATTCRYGYNFTLSTSVSNNNLYLNGDISNNASGTYFLPADGTTALNTATNTWGYYYNSNTSTTPTSTSVFSPVPTLSSPATIKTPLTSPASSNINDNFKIYYGVNSAPSMSIGTYKMIPDTNNSNNDGTLVYTATIADACLQYNVHFNPASYFEGNLITGTGTMTDQAIYEGVATPLANVTFSNPTTINNVNYYFLGWNTAQDGSGASYINTEDVLDLTSAGNNVTLYAMWTDCPGGNICYSANVSNPNDVEGEMGIQSINRFSLSYKLYVPNYKRSGYGFVAWNTKPDGTGINYGAHEILDFGSYAFNNDGIYGSGGLKLYAKWLASAGNMQNWSGCNSMNIGDVTALKDTRDNDVYAVAKLADGKCWMVENLRLDDSVILSSSNTNNPSLPLTNVYDTGSTSNHLSPSSSVSYDVTTAPYGWCDNSGAACVNQSRLMADNTTLFINNTASNYRAAGNVYRSGNLYNWYSATAGYGTDDKTSGNVAGDICPVGWHLPRGGDSDDNDFSQLDIALGGNGNTSNQNTNPTGSTMFKRWSSYPNNFIRAGEMRELLQNQNVYGNYWTSSARDTFYTYIFHLSDGQIIPRNNSYKYYGFAVRCIVGN